MSSKIKKILLVIVVAAIIVLAIFLVDFTPKRTDWGVTFSKQYAQYELGLNWQKAYLAILDDLKVDHIRLSAYWNEVEPTIGNYDFKDLDFQVNQASQRKVKIVLAVGRRLPRWPECHDPSWLSSVATSTAQASQLKYLQAVITRYADNPQIEYVQIENEPFLKYFGECPPLDQKFFKQEIALAKTLTDKPILITDSGELSSWIPASRAGGDILGTTLYRVVYNKTLGYFNWFWPPSLYFLKALTVRNFTPTSKVIVAELQGEAWHKAGINLRQTSLEEASVSMSLQQFQKNIAFSKQAGFGEVYLWGAEWWYMIKERDGYNGYWNEAQKLWQ